MNESDARNNNYYKICLIISTFFYYFWKLFVEIKSPNFEPWAYRTPSLAIGILFLIFTSFYPKLNKYAKEVFFINSTIVLLEFFYLIYLYCDSYMGLFYFMGGLIIVMPTLMAWRTKSDLKRYSLILIISSLALYVGVYSKTKIFSNQAFDYLCYYSSAFCITWFLSYLRLINADKLIQLTRSLQEKEESLIRSSRLASLGELAGGVAHEINNPLQILNLSLEVLKEEKNVKNFKILENMELTISRINSIVDGLSFFSGKSSDQTNKRTHFIKDILNKAINISHDKMSRNNIKLEVDADSSFLYCHDVQISQVFLSLLHNAFDSVVDSNEKKIKIQVITLPDRVEINVEDSGSEISPKIINDIFNPFFTTKPVGKGAGLGLSIAKGIVEQHGGTITYQNSPKRFQLIFPLASSYSPNNQI